MLLIGLFLLIGVNFKRKQLIIGEFISIKMGGCSSFPSKIQGKNNELQLSRVSLKPLITRLQTKFKRYRKQHLQQSQNSELIMLQQEIRNIYMGLIKENIMLANENKITMKECKLQISQVMLQVQVLVFKYIDAKASGEENVEFIKKFYAEMANFLVTLARFLKTIYPRGQSVQAGQLAKRFKEFDNTEDYEFDILKNAGFVFSSPDQFDITNTIKLFLNRIMKETDQNFSEFYQMIEGMDPSFKIGRKISENTSRYLKLDTGTVEIKSTEVARVLIKWMQDLSETLNYAQEKITAKNQYKFYKLISEQNRIQFSKCQQQSLTKCLNGGLLYCLQQQKTEAKKKADQRKSKFRKFNMHLIQLFNQVEHKQSEVSRQQMEIIKYSSFNNSFITWMVEEELVQTITHLIQASSEYQQFRGTLDLIKFKINDLMRCQIFGDKKKIIHVFEKFKELEDKDIIQLIKIKNRFSTPMGDAMIFFKMPKSFIVCECQLILSQQSKGEDAKKAKNIETLNHFLYELQRSPFGLLGEISVFLTAKSQTVSSYCDKIRLHLDDTRRIQSCLKQHKKGKQSKRFKQQKSPFVCSKCLRFFKKFQNKLRTHYCQKCIIFLCNGCMGEKFQITDQMISNTLDKKIATCQEEIKRSKLYRKMSQQLDIGFKQLTGRALIKDCFTYKKISQVPIIKESFKSNKIKVAAIIDYIHSKQDYVKIYMQKGVKVNFVIITWIGEETRLKCYKYDNDQGYIVNVFQPIQKYETHQFIEVNDFDLLAQFLSGGFCGVNQRNKDNNDGFQLKSRSQLQRGIYVFEGQTKQSTIQQLQAIPEDQRHKYLLKTYQINDQFSLIIDIDHSLKRSYQVDKIKQYLNQVAKNQQKKMLKMTDMIITNRALSHFNSHTNWTNKIKVLNLSDNNISNISIVLQLCLHLEKLDISRNRFTMLRFHRLLLSLEELNASQNRIEKIVNFSFIKKIESLKLRSNNLSALTKWVDGKKIKTGKGFGKAGNEKHVQVEQRQESSSFFGSFFNVCQLPISHRAEIQGLNLDNQWQQLQDEYQVVERQQTHKDKSTQTFVSLRQLQLGNNKFTTMKQFTKGYFPNLTFLDLNDNLIDQIPEINMEKLEEIHLANNRVKKIEDFAKIDNSSLTYLDLKNNKLQTIPKFNFHVLNKVNFSYNTIQKIDDFINGNYFQDLTHFHLSHIKVAKLTILPPSLKVLSIQNCQLVDNQLERFLAETQLPKLRELYLTRNKLTRLPRIDRLQKINAIYLEQNPISDISILEEEKRERETQQQVSDTTIKSKKKIKQGSEQDKGKKESKKKGVYLYLSRLWISLQVQDKKFITYKQHMQQYLLNTKIICWRYDSVFGAVIQRPKRQFFIFEHNQHVYKELLIKRIYLLNVFQHEVEINDRYQIEEDTGCYYLQHQWENIDMDEFVKYDWNQIDFIDLRGTGMDDKKWSVFTHNAYLFPTLKEIEIWDHKITNIQPGDLQKFQKLQKISFFESNAWANPLSQQSKDYLRKFKQFHPKVIVKFEEDNIPKNQPQLKPKFSLLSQFDPKTSKSST